MASPFSVFRKNQKAWMVPISILAMISFIFLGSMSRLGSGGKREDPDIFTWDFGTVHRSELNFLKTNFQALRQFLITAGTKAGLPPQQLASIDRQIPTSDRAIVNTMLLDKKAQQLGIVISDTVINSYINSLTEDKLRPQDLADAAQAVSQRFDGIGQTQLFDALRMQLAAAYAQMAFSPLLSRSGGMMGAVFRGDTPGDRWDYFCRLNRKVTAQILPVPVEKFAADIPDPSPEQLKSFYEQYKTDEPDPASPSPGFRQPYKAKFQYIKADYEQLMAAESPKITQQEIKDYYDNHKQEFIKTKLPELPESGKPGAEGAATAPAGTVKPDDTKSDAGPAKSGESKPADTKPLDTKSTGAKTNDAKSADTKAPPAKTGSTKSSDAKPGDPKSSDSKSGDSKKSDNQNKSSSNKQSFVPPPAPVNGKQTVATSLDGVLLAQADTKSAGQKSADAKSSSGKSPDASSSSKSSDTKPAGSKSSAGKSADAKPADAKSADSKTSDAKSSDAKMPETGAPDANAATPDRTVEYDPLDKVADTIRNQLAQQKVDDQVDAAFSAIESKIELYNRGLQTYRAAESRGNKTAKMPDPPDLAALAKPSGLEAKQTELISLEQAYNHTDLGKSRRSLVPGEYSAPSFIQSAYQLDSSSQPTLPTYQPQRSDDNDNNRYLWWKVADEAAHTPTLDEIKPEVTLAWKIIQARKPALAKANEDAAQARQLKQTLKETFGSVEGSGLSTVGPFSWLTQPVGQPFGAPRLTKVPGVEQAGDEFMKSIFALKAGETGVAANEPQTVYYVVQIESEEPTLDALHEEFMAKMSNEMSKIPYAFVGLEENQGMPLAWLKQVQNEFGYQLAPGETLSDTRSSSVD
ncbi:MAG TPA: hypothetical protein VMJ32_00985 [Pirellulales bacterium]|nr:hypothetical protein [Pirellulales bacterium]